jgi:hypothetical protein
MKRGRVGEKGGRVTFERSHAASLFYRFVCLKHWVEGGSVGILDAEAFFRVERWSIAWSRHFSSYKLRHSFCARATFHLYIVLTCK